MGDALSVPFIVSCDRLILLYGIVLASLSFLLRA